MEEIRKVRYRVVKKDIPEPANWPELELTIFEENEAIAMVREETITINCEMIEIMSFRSSKLRDVNIVIIELTNGKEYQVKVDYSKFKKSIKPWIQYANWVRDIDIINLEEEEFQKAIGGQESSGAEKK